METLWKDTKRHFGLPISFISYLMNEERLFRRSGVLVRREEQILLYHVRDLDVSVSLGQRIFGVGSIRVIGADATTPELVIENVKRPYEVRDLLYKYSEEDKAKRRMSRMEMIDEVDM